jgi:hypothetical protein
MMIVMTIEVTRTAFCCGELPMLHFLMVTSLRLFCQMGSTLLFALTAYIKNANLVAKQNTLKYLICYEGKRFSGSVVG